MVLVAEVLLGAVVLVLGAVLATGRARGLEDEAVDAPPMRLPAGPLGPEDLQAVRLPMAVRGYRMAEVDLLLDRLTAQLTAGPGASMADEVPDPGQPTREQERPEQGSFEQPGRSAGAEAGAPRQLLGVALVATATTAVAWVLSSAGVLPVLVAVLVSAASVLALPVAWQLHDPVPADTLRADPAPADPVPADPAPSDAAVGVPGGGSGEPERADPPHA